MKKYVVYILILGILIGINGCRKKKAQVKKIKIIYASNMYPIPATEEVIKRFNAIQNKIEVVHLNLSGTTNEVHDKYETILSRRSHDIDLFLGDVVWVAEMAQKGYILDIDDYIKRDNINLSNYIEGSLKATYYKNKIWGLPIFIDAGMLFYRKDIVATPPKSWDELIEMAKRYKGKKGTVDGYDFQCYSYEGLICNFLEYIYSYGGEVLDSNENVVIDSKEAKRGFEKFMEIEKSDFVPKDIKNYKEKESENNFLGGKSVFSRNWPYLWSESLKTDLKGKIGISPLPKGDKKSAAVLGGWVGMINKSTKHKEEAWEFLKFLASEEGEKIRAIKNGVSPTYIPLYRDKGLTELYPYFKNPEFLKALKAAVPRPVSPVYPKVSEIMQIEILKVINNEETIDQSLKNMEMKIKDAIKSK
ncbi:ABC transporter substrate-binding protein [Haliovirga abyssi]|uniref:ABC transporter substrate-binding protein n=1 Tax=Haliovirga abyssi TaxID=2996794 RepID=A0AAU9DBB7_9FUSO|nr:ABC transporter substrate-binding protein [Haliovirga abyssi]BDU50545.1 ABC transporter substrate-binding protein [Haliovirga abyssi]